jgi:hypothetical protein
MEYTELAESVMVVAILEWPKMQLFKLSSTPPVNRNKNILLIKIRNKVSANVFVHRKNADTVK